MSVKAGVCTMRNGYGVVLIRGTPGGMQRASGSSFEMLSLWSLYALAAQGWKGTSTPVATMSTFCRIALGSHAPEISGFPSALRGAGPEGGQAGLALAGADPGAAGGACAGNKAGMQNRISDRTRTSG